MTRKGIIIIVLLLISAAIIPFVIFSLQFFALEGGTGGVPPPDPTVYVPAPVLKPITPAVSSIGRFQLEWTISDEYESYNFKVYRRKDYSGNWDLVGYLFSSKIYIDLGLTTGTYEYLIQALVYIDNIAYFSESSNIQTAIVELFPVNPSIIINDDGTPEGANATNSLEVILTLSCDDADEMCFQISEDIWINWTAYETTYTITLFENDPWAPNYRVGVVFRNDAGETKEVCDDIIYDPDVPPPPDKDEEIDYTLAYVLIGVLIGLIGIGIFLKYRNQIIKSK